MQNAPFFTPDTLKYLNRLEKNNNRTWFNDNKAQYEQHVREPALRFIEAMSKRLPGLSRHFVASPKKTGGSLMRVYRDVRYAKEKTPYKTNIGIHFRHELAKDVHAPGYYLHIEKNHVFLGAGIWRPEPAVLKAIRASIDENPRTWRALRDDRGFNQSFSFSGESLKTAPRDFPKNHPLIEDLRRKDFIAIHELAPAAVVSADFLERAVREFKAARPLMRFLCAALDIAF